MATRTFSLTDAQAAALGRPYDRTTDGPTRIRYQAWRLYGSGYPVAQIAEITGCRRTSLMDWCRLYRDLGVAALVDGRVGGNRATLTPEQRETARASLHQ